jgi:hypothetical protein
MRLDAACVAVPAGAEAGHGKSSGLVVPAEALRPMAEERSRSGAPAFSAARLDEGLI